MMDIIQAMKERRSVRTYDGQPLTDEQKNLLLESARLAVNPFGGSYSVRIKEFDLAAGFKPSTYGVIKGAQDFFLIGIADDKASALAAGFGFEQTVLQAWRLGLGCCWIAATFKGSQFDAGQTWPDGQSLRIISPVGVAAKSSLMERFTRTALGSKNRKPFDTLFYDGDFDHPLAPDSRYGQALEMLRLAPSSTNSQPWRALVQGDTVHFYCKSKGPVSILDTGIGLCHFYETERYNGHTGTFAEQTAAPAAPNLLYVTSYTPN